MTPCKFRFDYPEITYSGFALGSTWNGFDNVAVTKETLDKICADIAVDGADEGSVAQFLEIEPMADGLYSLGWGFTTQIVDDVPYAIARKWVSRFGLGFHPDTRGKDYAPALSAAEIAEYDADMETLFATAHDPYQCGIVAMEEAGLC